MGTSQPAVYPSLLPNNPGYIVSTYGSVNGHPATHEVNQAIIEGMSRNGKISAARRFFILLTLFDVLFTFLVWVICVLTSSTYTIDVAFRKEVLSYSVKSSVFDIVVLAALRFTLILLFYILLRISHWWVIAVTTAGTGAFIISKVFLYDWTSSNKTASVVLFLCSFVISWGEAWFLDFRVVPSEAKALAFQAKQDPERVPFIPPSILSRSHSDDGSAFYSPPGSDNEEDSIKEHDGSTVSEVEWLSPKSSGDSSRLTEQDYRKQAADSMDIALNIIYSNGWRVEKREGDDVIYSQTVPKYGKVFKFVGEVTASPEKVIDELYFRGEEMHKWNPTVKRVKIVQKIDNDIDITHVIATEGAAGLVASRDFVNVRVWKKRNDEYIHASMATTHPDTPVVSNYVRGEQGPCVYVMTPVKNEPEKCQLQWLLNTNLKGWLPQYLIDQTLSTVMLEYVQSLRKQTANKENSV